MQKERDEEGKRNYTDKERQEIREWQSRHNWNSQEYKSIVSVLDSPLTESLDDILFDQLMEIHPAFPLTSFLLRPYPKIANQHLEHGLKERLPLVWVRRGITQ